MTYETLVMQSSPAGIAMLTLNRPGKLNALTDLMFTELHDAVRSLETRDDVRAIILTGSGRGFCAGLDLDLAAKLPAMPTTRFYALQRRWAAAIAALRFTPIPVIAAINGPAAGAGFSLALAADMRVISRLSPGGSRIREKIRDGVRRRSLLGSWSCCGAAAALACGLGDDGAGCP